ncbi:MAG: hypothetical protein WBY44_08790 [Bryobacteraceae bacterium]|jgi:hypothetical protein
MIENIDRRVLAGFRCVDAITGGSILEALTVSAAPLVLRRNHSGVFAVMDAPGFTALTTQFLAPAANSWPSPATFEITIEDPALRYLSRRATISAPQPLPVVPPPVGSAPTTTAPAGPAPLAPVTTPQTIVLYPTPAAPLAPNWAVVRVAIVSNATPPAPLPWAVIQVLGAGSPSPAGLTNQNGEALLAVQGLGLSLSSNTTGAVTETTTTATVTAWFDPSSLNKPKGWIPNPDDILLNLSSSQWKSVSQPVQLSPGQTVFVTLTISL